MVQERSDGINKDIVLPSIEPKKPALSWGLKIKKKLITVPQNLRKLRPIVGQCCHKCTPNSLQKKFEQNSPLGFQNLLNVNEAQTRYRGWLVRQVCCALFVSGCKVSASPATNRVERVCQSHRVKEVLAAAAAAAAAQQKAPKGQGEGKLERLAPFIPLINSCISPGFLRFAGWAMLKMFASLFGSIQVNLNHVTVLHQNSKEGSPLVYVYVRQSIMDCALIPLVLFCHNLRVPYTFCPLRCDSSPLRYVLQKVGVLHLPTSAPTEQEAEMDSLYSPVMTSLVRELLHEGQAISVGVSAESGLGGQWLARIRQLIKEGSVPDVSLVPVGISYDRVPKNNKQVSLSALCQWLWSLVWRRPQGCVRIHFAQPFSLKEMSESGRCIADEWLPLQDLLLPVILNNRCESVLGRRRMSWLLPSSHYASELEELTPPESDLSTAIILHLIFSASSCQAVMSSSLVSSLLLYKHPKGVSASVLCRDVAWLTEELFHRNKDVGFAGSLAEVVHYSLSLLAPHLIILAAPSSKDPFLVARPSLATSLHLARQAQSVTRTFILEAIGACTVWAMLCGVAASGLSGQVTGDSGTDGAGVMGDMDFDVVLCQSELTERALQLCHLLPPGFMPPCQSSHSFAVDAIDSLVRCGILIMEETPRVTPTCDFWKMSGALTWTTSDDPDDSDCEEQDLCSYKINQPNHCPEMLFFLCSLLAGHLRALSWATAGLDLIDSPLPESEFVAKIHSHLCDTSNKKKRQYESCSEEAAHTAVRTLIDLGVISEERGREGVCLSVSSLFQASENRKKLLGFITQYLRN